MWNLFISFLINVLVGEIMGRRQKFAEPAAAKAEIPTASEDRPQVYGVGVFRVAGNVVWSGDELAKRVKERVKVSLFSSKDVVVGHEYHVGLWMTLAGATCDAVTAIEYGDELVWQGMHQLANGVSELSFSKRRREDEAKVDDGIEGTFRFFNTPRGWQPVVNTYVEGQVKEQVPAYPGTLHAVWVGPAEGEQSNKLLNMTFKNFKNGFIGATPHLKSMLITLKRLPDVSDALPRALTLSWPVQGSLNDAPVREALAAWLKSVEDIEGDANPALAALELLTTRGAELGPRWSAWALDTESFLRAAARLKEEGLGISASWESTTSVKDILTAICTIARAAPVLNHATGRIGFRLFRRGDAARLSFDDSNVIELTSFERKAPEEVPNLIEIPFSDRENRFADRVAHAKNLAGVKTAGAVVVERVEMLGVSTERIAKLLANRELRERSAPWATVSFSAFVQPGEAPIYPGDLVELHHEPLGQRVRVRVTSVRYGSLADSQTVRIEGVEDVFRDGFPGGGVSPLPPKEEPAGPPVDPSAGPRSTMMLAPYALTGQLDDQPLLYVLPGSAGAASYRVGTQPSATWVDGYPPTFAEQTAQTALAGTLTASLPAEALGGVGIALNETMRAAAVASALPANCFLIVGEEWLYVDSLLISESVLYAQIKARGVFDSSPWDHVKGAEVVVLTDYVVYPEVLRTDDSLRGVDKLVARAEVAGRMEAGTETAYRYVTFQSPGRASKPLPPGAVYILGGAWPAHTPERADVMMPRGSGIAIAWKWRDRDLKAITNYRDDSFQYCGLRACVRVGWQLDNGAWVDNDIVRSGVDDQGMYVSTTMVPAGPRLGRVRVWGETPGGLKSRERVLYFKYA